MTLLIGVVHVLNVDELDVGADFMVGIQVERFLRISNITNQ
jgi:hypothetical protein